MADNAYRPGAWFAVVGPDAAVLVDDQLTGEQLAAAWRAVQSSAGTAELIDSITAGNGRPGPAFGVVARDGEMVRVLLRAGVTADVVDTGGDERSIDVGGVSASVDYLASSLTRVTLGRAGAGGGGSSLPIGSGVVQADSVDWCPGAVASPNTRSTTTTTVVVPHLLIDQVPPLLADADDEDESDDDDAVDESPAEQVGIAPDDAEVSGDHDGYTLARSSVEAMQRESSSAPTVQAVFCPQLHANAPHARQCRICGSDIDDQEPVTADRPTLGRLRFSSGHLVELDRRVVVGRSPSAERVSGDDLPHLVQVDSPEQDVSRTHAEVRLEGWHVLLVDLHSANGTVVTLPGRTPERLHPQEPYPLVPGALVDLAGEVSFTYEAST